MAKAMDMLKKLLTPRKAQAEGDTVFDLRLKKMGGVRHVTVANAVLFRNQPSQMEV